jgi:hypothetical protein
MGLKSLLQKASYLGIMIFYYIVPVAVFGLMLLDYFLTIYSQKLMLVRFQKHFAIENVELNPQFQNAVQKMQWLNWKHLVQASLYALFIALLVWVAGLGDEADESKVFLDFALAIPLTIFGLVNARHVTNILIFKNLIKHPEQVEGQVRLTRAYAHHASLATFAGLLVPFALFTAYTLSYFSFGCLTGLISLIWAQKRWKSKADKSPSQ